MNRVRRDLPYGHERYFHLSPGTEIMGLDRLHPTKPPESQLSAVANARARMAEAAAGRIDRRAPLLVREREDGAFDIVDGNATYGVALELGWPDLPVVVEVHDPPGPL